MLSFVTGTIVTCAVVWLTGGALLSCLPLVLGLWIVAIVAVAIFTGGA
jgi:hypothetical protein